MKIQMYSIFDIAAGAFNTPFFQQNDLLAKRIFRNLTEDPETSVGKNPEDFSLHHVGEFCDEEGVPDDMVVRGLIMIGKEKENA